MYSIILFLLIIPLVSANEGDFNNDQYNIGLYGYGKEITPKDTFLDGVALALGNPMYILIGLIGIILVLVYLNKYHWIT